MRPREARPEETRMAKMTLKDPKLLCQKCYVNGAWIDADDGATLADL